MKTLRGSLVGSFAVAIAVVGLGASVAFYSHAVSAAPQASADATAAEAEAQSGPMRVKRAVTPRRGGVQALDRSGRRQVGTASFYAERYFGRTMADGTPMLPNGNNAASVTLPLGTTAKVTNLETGHSAIVTIRDRGPYVNGRIIDLSPATARVIGLEQRRGLARVEVLPLAVPQADGSVRRIATNLRSGSAAHQG